MFYVTWSVLLRYNVPVSHLVGWILLIQNFAQTDLTNGIGAVWHFSCRCSRGTKCPKEHTKMGVLSFSSWLFSFYVHDTFGDVLKNRGAVCYYTAICSLWFAFADYFLWKYTLANDWYIKSIATCNYWLCIFFCTSDIQREEEKVKRSIKDAAKKGQKDVCVILAKELIRSRKAVSKLYASKAHMNSVLMGMKNQLGKNF